MASARDIATLNTPAAPKPHFLDGVAANAVRQRLAGLHHGVLTLRDGAREDTYGRHTERCALNNLSATVQVLDPRFYSEIAFGGSIGAGEAYMQGYWRVDDLTTAMRILLQNREVLDGMETGLARLAAPLQKALHWMARNTRAGSSRNIQAHYDLGNDFFQLFLDPTMMYSAAVFERPDMTLEEASIAKLDRICRKLELKPGDRVVEIGTGWGGFAMHAARHYGCHVTTTTISPAQHALARERIAAAGLSSQIELLLTDYRDLTGQYDKLVSIEMIEAVGHHFYDTYFGQCSRLLKPDGAMLLQAITIADQRYEAAKNSVDFIQRYIFPGSCIPSVTAISEALTRATDLRLTHLEDIGPHYATTLRCWNDNFSARLDRVRALGYPEAFIRMWEFYLCYCEAGFLERVIGDAQMLLVKPQIRLGVLTAPLTGAFTPTIAAR
jgi:cyclopropane-fatty-acyl-phospholipid synthase